MKPTITPTALNLYKDCQRCFWLTKKKLWKRPPTPFPSLPRGLDTACKDRFSTYTKQGMLPPELCDLNGYALFEDEALLSVWQNNWKGITWSTDIGTLRGAVDCILRKNERLLVLDFKSRSSPPKEETIAYYVLQLSLYTLLLQQNCYETAEHAYLLFYYPTKFMGNSTVLRFETTLVKVSVDTAKARAIFEDALACLNGAEPTAQCPHCKHVNR